MCYLVQDTIVALEALSTYALSRPDSPHLKMSVHFHVPGKSQTESLSMVDIGPPVETDLKVTQHHTHPGQPSFCVIHCVKLKWPFRFVSVTELSISLCHVTRGWSDTVYVQQLKERAQPK